MDKCEQENLRLKEEIIELQKHIIGMLRSRNGEVLPTDCDLTMEDIPDIMLTLAETLRRERVKNDISQKRFASMMKLSASAVSLMESGGRDFTLENFFKCCILLNVSPASVLSEVLMKA